MCKADFESVTCKKNKLHWRKETLPWFNINTYTLCFNHVSSACCHWPEKQRNMSAQVIWGEFWTCSSLINPSPRMTKGHKNWKNVNQQLQCSIHLPASGFMSKIIRTSRQKPHWATTTTWGAKLALTFCFYSARRPLSADPWCSSTGTAQQWMWLTDFNSKCSNFTKYSWIPMRWAHPTKFILSSQTWAQHSSEGNGGQLLANLKFDSFCQRKTSQPRAVWGFDFLHVWSENRMACNSDLMRSCTDQ